MKHEIVVAYDGSPQSRAAVEWAAQECRSRRRTGMTVCEVWDGPYPERAEAVAAEERRLAGVRLFEGVRLAERLLPGREVRPVLLRGDPGDRLVALSRDAEMLVLGHRDLWHRDLWGRDLWGRDLWARDFWRRGLGGFAGLLLRSVSAYAAAHAVCPVVVVGASGERPSRGGVVVAVDASRPSPAGEESLMRFATEVAVGRALPLTIVYAAGPPGPGAAEGERALARIAEPWRRRCGARLAVETRVVPERAQTALMACAREARLLVLGAGGTRARLLGPVGRALLRRAPCPVAVVHPAPS